MTPPTGYSVGGVVSSIDVRGLSMHRAIITMKARRVGRYRWDVLVAGVDSSGWVRVKTTPEGAVDSLDVRYDGGTSDLGSAVPFESLPPVARALVRGLADAVVDAAAANAKLLA
jgi:hypothetical protein